MARPDEAELMNRALADEASRIRSTVDDLLQRIEDLETGLVGLRGWLHFWHDTSAHRVSPHECDVGLCGRINHLLFGDDDEMTGS